MPKTRAKNKSSHPAAPIMTPTQLRTAGISVPQPKKKQTKSQRISALEEDNRIRDDLLRMVLKSSPLRSDLLMFFFLRITSPVPVVASR